MQRTLLSFYLLETQIVIFGIKILQARPIPLLVLFRIVLLQPTDILGALLQDLFLKLRLWQCLRGSKTCTILAELEFFGRRQRIELPPFGGIRRGCGEVGIEVGIGRVIERPLRRQQGSSRHAEDYRELFWERW